MSKRKKHDPETVNVGSLSMDKYIIISFI